MAQWMNSINFALAGIMVVTLLTWGIYAVQFTSPNDKGSIITAAVNGEFSSASNFGFNGTVVKPSSEAQFIMIFQTKPSSAFGTFNLLSEGYSLGPQTWTEPSSTFSSFQREYVLFSIYITCLTACSYSTGPNGNMWLSGPQGNASQWMDTYDAFVRPLGSLSLTLIMQIESAGNYTLHYVNNGPSNARAIVSMGASMVDFSRPFLYAGAASLAIAAAFSVMIGVATWMRRRERPVTQETNQGRPAKSSVLDPPKEEP